MIDNFNCDNYNDYSLYSSSSKSMTEQRLKFKDLDDLVRLVNKVAFESMKNGADIGGSYDSNEQGMRESLENFAEFIGLKKYSVDEVRLNDDKCGFWTVLQITNYRY